MSDQRWAATETAAYRGIRRTVLAVAVALTTIVFTGGVETAGQSWSVTPGIAESRPIEKPAGPDGQTTDDGPQEPPTRVRIPAIQVDSPLEDLTLDSAGALRAPVDYARAGWYAEGTVPGDVGPAVIAGHVDSHKGPAVFFRLYQLHPDDLIQVQRGERWVIFRVVATARYPKDRFPTADVYGPTPDAQLRLITCGGVFNKTRRSYVDNVVVYAVAIE
jgi:sortase (surface protein transpeptidase)